MLGLNDISNQPGHRECRHSPHHHRCHPRPSPAASAQWVVLPEEHVRLQSAQIWDPVDSLMLCRHGGAHDCSVLEPSRVALCPGIVQEPRKSDGWSDGASLLDVLEACMAVAGLFEAVTCVAPVLPMDLTMIKMFPDVSLESVLISGYSPPLQVKPMAARPSVPAEGSGRYPFPSD